MGIEIVPNIKELPEDQLSNQEKEIIALLARNGITYKWISTGTSTPWDDKTEYDSWIIMFNNEKFDYYTGIGHRKFIQERWNRNVYARVAPTPARVLYSLVMDASAGQELFADFCDNFGYDSDSIKALKVYEACQGIALQMRKVFNSTLLAEIEQILEDY